MRTATYKDAKRRFSQLCEPVYKQDNVHINVTLRRVRVTTAIVLKQ
jgi:hypothetical protein